MKKWPHIREIYSGDEKSMIEVVAEPFSLGGDPSLPVVASHCPGRTYLVSWGFNSHLCFCLHMVTFSFFPLLFVRTPVTLDKRPVLIQCVLIHCF